MNLVSQFIRVLLEAIIIGALVHYGYYAWAAGAFTFSVLVLLIMILQTLTRQP